MPGQPWLNKKRSGGGESPDAAERRRTIDAGLRQEWREGVPNNAPVDPDKAIAAAGRAAAASPGSGNFAAQPPRQANAYGPPVTPGQAPE